MGVVRRSWLWLGTVLWALPSPASAQQDVVVTFEADDEAIFRWTQLELRELGFDVRLDAPDARARMSLRRSGSELALRLAETGNAPEEIRIANDEPRVVALRIAELVRARWLPLVERARAEAAPESGDAESGDAESDDVESGDAESDDAESAASAPDAALAGSATESTTPDETDGSASDEPTSSAWSLGVGAGWTHSLGVAGAVRAHAEVRVRVHPRLVLGATARVPTAPMRVSLEEGEVDVFATDLQALLLVPVARGGVEVHGGLEAGLLLLRLRGNADAPFQDRTERLQTATGSLRVDVSIPLLRWLRLDLGLSAGLAFSPPTLRIAGRDVHRLAHPIFNGWITFRGTP
ncbi:MAG: hypothetical protein AAGE52_34680 [Myxococcota bacterium]